MANWSSIQELAQPELDFLGLVWSRWTLTTRSSSIKRKIQLTSAAVKVQDMLARAHIALKISHTTWNPCRIHREKPRSEAWQTASLCIASADCTPPLLELDMQLCCLQHANEHHDESTPSEENLNKPPFWLCWESGELAAIAVTGIPKCTASSIGPTLVLGALSGLRLAIWPSPWRVGVACAGKISWHAYLCIDCATQFP